MSKFKRNEAAELDAQALKQYTNRNLPAGYSAAVSADDKGVTIDVYDSDVMVLSIPVGGLSQGAAEKAGREQRALIRVRVLVFRVSVDAGL